MSDYLLSTVITLLKFLVWQQQKHAYTERIMKNLRVYACVGLSQCTHLSFNLLNRTLRHDSDDQITKLLQLADGDGKEA